MTPINQLNSRLLVALGLSAGSAEIVMERIAELETENKHAVVALKNITDSAVPCTGDKNHIVPSWAIKDARTLLANKTHQP